MLADPEFGEADARNLPPFTEACDRSPMNPIHLKVTYDRSPIQPIHLKVTYGHILLAKRVYSVGDQPLKLG